MTPPKQAGVAILISEKVNFKLKLVKRDKGHFKLKNNNISRGNNYYKLI
jgi:hypothetical protein